MKKAMCKFSALTALFMPALALAQSPNFNYVNSTVSEGENLLQHAITVIMVLLTLYFLYSVLRFIMDKGEKPEDTKNKRKAMINGLIGLFVAVGVWGIIHLAGSLVSVNTVNPDQQGSITCPPGMIQGNGGVCVPN